MGIMKYGSKSSYDNVPSKIDLCEMVKDINEFVKHEPPLPNPDPKNYIVRRSAEIGHYLVLELCYPDCVNYEGTKILVYDNDVRLVDLLMQGSIDPHFSENLNFKSPIARFVPSPGGWTMAVRFCDMMEGLSTTKSE